MVVPIHTNLIRKWRSQTIDCCYHEQYAWPLIARGAAEPASYQIIDLAADLHLHFVNWLRHCDELMCDIIADLTIREAR